MIRLQINLQSGPYRGARCSVRAAILLAWLSFGAGASAQSQVPQSELQHSEVQQVEVVGTSPLPGQGIDRDLLPYSTQVVRRSALDQAQAEHLTDYMARRMPGMQVNDIQGSPFQSDLTFRGYRASGLLGASQGLSVYLDGVRINEPFGDVVNWDMLPEFALDSVSIVPGANPAFGLNTLGGAISFTTASGLSAPGVRAELGFGGHGRKQAEIGYGHASDDGWHQFIGASAFAERGWRDQSAGRLSQVFAKLGHSEGDDAWSVSVLGGRSTLIGNSLLPAFTIEATDEGITRVPDLYASRRAAVYTYPDPTTNRLGQITVNVDHHADARADLSLLAYVRNFRRDTSSGDTADVVPASSADSTAPNAALNATQTRQSSWGGGANFSQHAGDHRWQLGATLDASQLRFRQTAQDGFFTSDRGVVAADAPAQPTVAVQGDTRLIGLYASDTWRLAAGTHLTATARYNHASVTNTLSTVQDGGSDLSARPRESFTYTSLNPALGLTHQLDEALTLFGNLARNTRVPTVIELGCADPLEPCRLPAGLQSDPHLNQVRSTSLEFGARWKPAPGQSFEFTAFRTDNRDDIVFGSVSTTSQLGYFQNFPRTRNQGFDAQWLGRFGSVTTQLAWSYLAATYQASGVLRAGERNVDVTPGLRMAGLPRQQLKIGADWQVQPDVSIGADMQALSSRVTQGNEDGRFDDNNPQHADLALPGYALLHLRASWRVTSGVELLLRLNNVFDRRYETYAALGATVFTAEGSYTGEPREALFVAPGAPRSVFAGLRASF